MTVLYNENDDYAADWIVADARPRTRVEKVFRSRPDRRAALARLTARDGGEAPRRLIGWPGALARPGATMKRHLGVDGAAVCGSSRPRTNGARIDTVLSLSLATCGSCKWRVRNVAPADLIPWLAAWIDRTTRPGA